MWILRTRVLKEFTWAAWMLLVLLTNQKMMPLLVTVNGTAKEVVLDFTIAGLEFGSGRASFVRAWDSRGFTRSPEPTKCAFQGVFSNPIKKNIL